MTDKREMSELMEEDTIKIKSLFTDPARVEIISRRMGRLGDIHIRTTEAIKPDQLRRINWLQPLKTRFGWVLSIEIDHIYYAFLSAKTIGRESMARFIELISQQKAEEDRRIKRAEQRRKRQAKRRRGP